MTIKVAMREFTDGWGGELVKYCHEVMALPNVLEVGEKVINVIPQKLDVLRLSLQYGIGLPVKMQPNTAHRQLILNTMFAPGTDMAEIKRRLEAGDVQGKFEAPTMAPGAILDNGPRLAAGSGSSGHGPSGRLTGLLPASSLPPPD